MYGDDGCKRSAWNHCRIAKNVGALRLAAALKVPHNSVMTYSVTIEMIRNYVSVEIMKKRYVDKLIGMSASYRINNFHQHKTVLVFTGVNTGTGGLELYFFFILSPYMLSF